MPSQPDPNSPYMDSRLQSLFGRTPGTPQTAGNPTPQTSAPSFPAPPGVNSAPAGRPTNGPSFPAPPPTYRGQVIDRLGGQVIDRGRGQVIDRSSGQVIDRSQGEGGPHPNPPPLPVPGDGSPLPDTVPSSPLPEPTASPLPEPTALGTMATMPDGSNVTTLSPDGQAKYQQAIVQKRREFGPMPRLFGTIPGLPPPPIELGRSWYNPFSGRFGK